MKPKATRFRVVCLTAECTWSERYATHAAARAAGKRHEQAHGSHITGVLPPGEEREAA